MKRLIFPLLLSLTFSASAREGMVESVSCFQQEKHSKSFRILIPLAYENYKRDLKVGVSLSIEENGKSPLEAKLISIKGSKLEIVLIDGRKLNFDQDGGPHGITLAGKTYNCSNPIGM